MKTGLGAILAAVIVVLVLASMSLFSVDQRERAIVFQLGEIKEVIEQPGLNVKWPLIQNVRFFDRRILTLDTPDAERFITSEKKNVLVDSFLKWRIADVRQYYVSVRGDELLAQTRLQQRVNSALREEFGKRTVHDYIHRPRFELYDLENDPHEVHNLADRPEHADRLKAMQAKLQAFQKQTKDPWELKWRYE